MILSFNLSKLKLTGSPYLSKTDKLKADKDKRLIKPLLVVRVETEVRLQSRGTGDKSNMAVTGPNRYSQHEGKKKLEKRKINRTQKLTRGTTSNHGPMSYKPAHELELTSSSILIRQI